jgi:hypothetical protein
MNLPRGEKGTAATMHRPRVRWPRKRRCVGTEHPRRARRPTAALITHNWDLSAVAAMPDQRKAERHNVAGAGNNGSIAANIDRTRSAIEFPTANPV